MTAPKGTLLWLAGLAAAAGLYVYSRTKKGELQVIDATGAALDSLDEIVVTAQKLPTQVKEAAQTATTAVKEAAVTVAQTVLKYFPPEVSAFLNIRGIRNNNPGNIDHRDPWLGLVPSDKRTDARFAEFVHPKYGIRALAKVLKTYARTDDGPSTYGTQYIDTVGEVINRWAPPIENDTGAYAAAVARELGVNVNTRLDLGNNVTLQKLAAAIIKHENGVQPYTAAIIAEGIALA